MIGYYFLFNRNCAEAIKTYQAAFDAEVAEVQKYGQMPPNPSFPIAESDKELVLHARVVICGAEVMCADSLEHGSCGDNMYASISVKDEAFIKKAWDILKQDGEVHMELAPTFFSGLHGSLRDRFGINWMFTAMK